MKKLINLLFLVMFACGVSSAANATKMAGGGAKYVLNAQVDCEPFLGFAVNTVHNNRATLSAFENCFPKKGGIKYA